MSQQTGSVETMIATDYLKHPRSRKYWTIAGVERVVYQDENTRMVEDTATGKIVFYTWDEAGAAGDLPGIWTTDAREFNPEHLLLIFDSGLLRDVLTIGAKSDE